jgi:hypothetical protein
MKPGHVEQRRGFLRGRFDTPQYYITCSLFFWTPGLFVLLQGPGDPQGQIGQEG